MQDHANSVAASQYRGGIALDLFLQQVLNGRSGACKLLQHICMVCKVLGQVAIEGGSLLAILDNALQLLLFH